MPSFATAIPAAISAIGALKGGGGSEAAAGAAGFDVETARKIMEIYEEVELPFRKKAVKFQKKLIPKRAALDEAGLDQATADLERYGEAVPGLESQLLGGIEEGVTDRTDRRAQEAISRVEQQFGNVPGTIDMYASRRGATPGDTMSRNQLLQTELAKAASGATEANKAVDRELLRLDEAKVNYPMMGLNYFGRSKPNPNTDILAGTQAVSPSQIPSTASAQRTFQGQADREADGIGGLANLAAGADWDKFLGGFGGGATTAPAGIGPVSGIWT